MPNQKDCAYPSPDHIQTWHSTYHRDNRNGWSRNYSFRAVLPHTNIVRPFLRPLLRLPSRNLHRIFFAWRKELKVIAIFPVRWRGCVSDHRTLHGTSCLIVPLPLGSARDGCTRVRRTTMKTFLQSTPVRLRE